MKLLKMADNSRKTSISRLFTRCPPPPPHPVRAFKNAAPTFVRVSCKRITSFVCKIFGCFPCICSFRKLLTIGSVWRDQISKRISRFVAIVIGVNKNTRESTFIDLFLFSKILENSNIGRLDDRYISRFG